MMCFSFMISMAARCSDVWGCGQDSLPAVVWKGEEGREGRDKEGKGRERIERGIEEGRGKREEREEGEREKRGRKGKEKRERGREKREKEKRGGRRDEKLCLLPKLKRHYIAIAMKSSPAKQAIAPKPILRPGEKGMGMRLTVYKIVKMIVVDACVVV